jgi:DNA-directed RNA polymerase subunit RPC12/RpoP
MDIDKLKKKLKEYFRMIRSHVIYECEDCDFEAPRKDFDTEGEEVQCPRCGSRRVYMDD